MGMYLYIGSYTREGRSGLIAEGGTSRESETRKLVAGLGGVIHQYQFALGDFDFIIVADMPDDTAALAAPLLASATGTVGVKTIKLLTPAQMDDVAAKARSLSFRGAGS